jgi:hypothetical protein
MFDESYSETMPHAKVNFTLDYLPLKHCWLFLVMFPAYSPYSTPTMFQQIIVVLMKL